MILLSDPMAGVVWASNIAAKDRAIVGSHNVKCKYGSENRDCRAFGGVYDMEYAT